MKYPLNNLMDKGVRDENTQKIVRPFTHGNTLLSRYYQYITGDFKDDDARACARVFERLTQNNDQDWLTIKNKMDEYLTSLGYRAPEEVS